MHTPDFSHSLPQTSTLVLGPKSHEEPDLAVFGEHSGTGMSRHASGIGWIMLWKQIWLLSRRCRQSIELSPAVSWAHCSTLFGHTDGHLARDPVPFAFSKTLKQELVSLSAHLTVLSFPTVLPPCQSFKATFPGKCSPLFFSPVFCFVRGPWPLLCSPPNLGSFFILLILSPFLFCNIPWLLVLISICFSLLREQREQKNENGRDPLPVSECFIIWFFFSLHCLNELPKIYGNQIPHLCQMFFWYVDTVQISISETFHSPFSVSQVWWWVSSLGEEKRKERKGL